MKFEIEAEEVIEKTVKPISKAGHVYVPKNWIGRKVKICLTSPTVRDYRNFRIISKKHDREFVGELIIYENNTRIKWFHPNGATTSNILETINGKPNNYDMMIMNEINKELDNHLIQYIVNEIDHDYSFFRLEISK